jgi:HEAT repeat protein
VEAIVALLRTSSVESLENSHAPFALSRIAKVERLLDLVGDAEPAVRWGALRALAFADRATIKDEHRARGFDIVLRALADGQPAVRDAASMALAAVPPPQVTIEALRVVRGFEPRARDAVAAALASVADAAALAKALSHADRDVRAGAATTLAAMRAAAAPAVPTLVRALERDPELEDVVIFALLGVGEAAVPALIGLYPGFPKHRGRIAQAAEAAGAAALPHAVALLEHADPEVRHAGVRLVMRLGDRAFDALLRAAGDPDPRVRGEALAALGRFRDRPADVCPVLVREIGHEAARRALQEMGPAAFPFVEGAALDPDAAVRAFACQVLGAHGERALPPLRRALRDPEEPVRAAAASAVGRLGPHAQPALPDLAGALRDGAPAVRIAAAAALARLGDVAVVALPELARLFEGGDLADRRATGKALAAIGAPSVPFLVGLLRSKEDPLRFAAAQCLAEIGAPALAALVDAMGKGEDPLLTDAGEALTRMGRAGVHALVGLLGHDDADVRRHAAWRLGQKKREAREAIPALIAALDDKGAFVSSQAAWALGQIGPLAADALPRLEAMRRAGEHVRVVDDAIARIRGP